jgi:hypothetical protein
MPAQSNWIGNWSSQTNTAVAQLNAVKRQFNSDINARIRMVRNAQRITPTEAPPSLQHLVRAPLAGLR